MVLAPATIARFGGARQIYFSGLVAWDKHLSVLHANAPRRQVRHVLELLEACLAEQGGGRASVLRLRPFTHSAAMADVIRDEISRFWRDAPPSVCIFDATPFGDPPQLHLELQAVAVVPDGPPDGAGAPGPGGSTPLSVCHRRAGEAKLASIAELTATAATGDADTQAARLVEQLASDTEATGMALDDVRRVFAFVTSEAVEDAVRRRLRAATDAVLHAVPVASLSGPGGVTVKAEATAVRHAPRAG